MNIQYLFKKLLLLYRYRGHLPRVRAIDMAMDYIKYAKVHGDYFEFGVFNGTTFSYACHSAIMRGLTSRHFIAFDSFAGFSKVNPNDTTGVLKEGDRSFPLEKFLARIKSEKIDTASITVVPGFFEDTLAGSHASNTNSIVGERAVAVAYLDADLYEPTKLALDFISNRLSDGALLMFDNWFLLKGHPERGERRAFEEWQSNHPEFIVSEYHRYGWCGKVFMVNRSI